MINLEFSVGETTLYVFLVHWEDNPVVKKFVRWEKDLKPVYKSVFLNKKYENKLNEFLSQEYAYYLEGGK